MSTRKIERDLYLAQRALGDVRAAERGPEPLVRRVVKRRVHRTILRGLRKLGAW